jgi:hypothetical protein
LVVAIDIKLGAVEEVKKELDYSGINEYALFPDLEIQSRSQEKVRNRVIAGRIGIPPEARRER